VLVVALVQAIFKYTKQVNSSECRRIATFIEYKTNNAEIIEFQTYRVIQVKTPVFKNLDIQYHWTGSQSANITSDLQEIEILRKDSSRTNTYGKARLSLTQPKLYNEAAVFHYRITAHDYDHISETKVELKIDEPIDLVRVNISLGYKPATCNEVARLERSIIKHDGPPKYEFLRSISFDPILKEYVCTLQYPEPGYFYRISWDR
ncbi:MAG: hypothetical protein K2G23_08625, partial [Muribaculaceae bacterium]|nr:hypothetical protein [Muribaculaceae bacterium]